MSHTVEPDRTDTEPNPGPCARREGARSRRPPEEQLGFALFTAHNAVMRAHRPLLARVGLTYAEYMVLLALWDRDNVLVGQLANRLTVPVSGLSTLLTRLEVAGLLVRLRGQEDRRNVTVILTDTGRDLETQAEAIADTARRQTTLNPDILSTLRRRGQPRL